MRPVNMLLPGPGDRRNGGLRIYPHAMPLTAVTGDGTAKDQRVGQRLLTLTGGRVTRHTVIYVIGLLAVAPFSLISGNE